jgi:hypothetical protein
MVLMLAVLAMGAKSAAAAKKDHTKPRTSFQATSPAPHIVEEPHRFFDRTNVVLFTAVAAVRALDFTSTEHFRKLGDNEVLLTNSIVDNKPLFAGIEVGGAALSIGVAYWLHRTGHHSLERWVSAVHIGVGAVGDIHNYSLGPPH